MIALSIKNQKLFMKQLLVLDTFDHFLVSEASVTTFVSYHIDGALHREYYGTDADTALPDADRIRASWADIRPFLFLIIRGRKAPLSFKFVLQLPAQEVALLIARSKLSLTPGDVFGLYLNCQYTDGHLTLTSGSSLRVFTLDRSLDEAFDAMIRDFLGRQEIDFDE